MYWHKQIVFHGIDFYLKYFLSASAYLPLPPMKIFVKKKIIYYIKNKDLHLLKVYIKSFIFQLRLSSYIIICMITILYIVCVYIDILTEKLDGKKLEINVTVLIVNLTFEKSI